MLDTARRELAHIPDWPFQQRILRQTYWNLRLNSLGKTAEVPNDPLKVIERAIAIVMQGAPPGTKLEYDVPFFRRASEQTPR
jgi:hypothetical protein